MINFSVWGLILGDKFLVVIKLQKIVRVKFKINPREHIQNALCTGFSMFILQFDKRIFPSLSLARSFLSSFFQNLPTFFSDLFDFFCQNHQHHQLYIFFCLIFALILTAKQLPYRTSKRER